MGRRISFYTDEHVAKSVVRALRQRGVDVLTAREASLLGADDEAHLARAVREGRTMFTQDADFLRFHAAGTPHCGIVYAPQETPVRRIIHGLMLVHQVLDAEEMENQLEFL